MMLPASERARVLERCKHLHLPARNVIYPAGGAIDAVYFPLGGMVSLVLSTRDGQTVEIGTVGNEGLLGTPLVLGVQRSHMEALVQVEGEFLRMSRRDLEREFARGGALLGLAERFAQALSDQISQSVLCNRLHSVDERLSRWFLMVHDRVGSDDIQLTQQFVAQMLGVRRPSVTVAASMLQKAGFVRYSRGRLHIVDRKGLEAGACECYQAVRRRAEDIFKG
jgi:CRP-like cAMP-binding protein